MVKSNFPCPFCQGTGYNHGLICQICHGRGELQLTWFDTDRMTPINKEEL